MSTVAEGRDAAVVDAPDRERVPKSTIGSIPSAFPNAFLSALQKHPSLEWLLPLALCLILLAQMLFSVQRMSQHADKATHLYAGYRALKCGDYTFGREHPPLAKMLAATPLLWSNILLDCSQREEGADEEEQATH